MQAVFSSLTYEPWTYVSAGLKDPETNWVNFGTASMQESRQKPQFGPLLFLNVIKMNEPVLA